MNTDKNNNMTLKKILVNRRMINELASQGLISSEARHYAMNLLYPERNLILWVSRLLLALGVSLILSGIVYFFAFNWTKITPEIKFGSIQLSIFGCLAGAYFSGLTKLSGKIMLLCASVLTGVFLAVFGQIYQTGADSYQLFMMWALLILPWTLLSEFAALWLVWLVIANIFGLLYLDQTTLPEHGAGMMTISYLMIFNAAFLGLREFFASKGKAWLQDRLTRRVLVGAVLVYALIPTGNLIMEPSGATHAIIFGAALSAIIHGVFYIVYRYKTPDMPALSATVLSACFILQLVLFKALNLFLSGHALEYLSHGFIIMGVFALATILLRNIAKETEAHNNV
jgi:uncharacterized membrane protein